MIHYLYKTINQKTYLAPLCTVFNAFRISRLSPQVIVRSLTYIINYISSVTGSLYFEYYPIGDLPCRPFVPGYLLPLEDQVDPTSKKFQFVQQLQSALKLKVFLRFNLSHNL